MKTRKKNKQIKPAIRIIIAFCEVVKSSGGKFVSSLCACIFFFFLLLIEILLYILLNIVAADRERGIYSRISAYGVLCHRRK